MGLIHLTNIQVDNLNWVQASFQVKDGGLGICSVDLLTLSAYLACIIIKMMSLTLSLPAYHCRQWNS